MKIRLNENRTIPVNQDLLEYVLLVYEAWYLAYKNVYWEEGVNPMNIPTKNLVDNGGFEYLKKMKDVGFSKIILDKEKIQHHFNFKKDKILSRFLSEDEIYRRMAEIKDTTITLLFNLDDQDASGRFWEYSPSVDRHNMISITFPFDSGPDTSAWTKIKETIRHEMQHFTQSFYSKILGTKNWIGLPKKKAYKGKNIHGTDDTIHQDVPVEMSTDVQDEIDLFFRHYRWLAKADPEQFKRFLLRFIGINGGTEASDVYAHYLKTNKEVWKWAVNKLLYAVSRM